jgi:glucosamine--fructose-6-phosphate aminotransferase (isomerizing)
MCTLAAYIGSEPAAPRLLDLLAREEGWAGAYYTGLATVHEGKLHLRKVVGDLSTLLRETDAHELPGTIGIAHSRSKSGGDREWGHPFADSHDRLAYVANGARGAFTENRANDHVARLRAGGRAFRSLVKEPVGNYPCLADGSCIHFSEIMCQLIAKHLHDEANAPLEAMSRAFLEFPAEIVGLALSADHSDRILGFRGNMPLMMGRNGKGTMLASTAMAFPDPAPEWLMPMPPNCAFTVSRDTIDIQPFAVAPRLVGDWHPLLPKARELILAELQAGPRGLGALNKIVLPLWPDSVLAQKDFLVYETIRQLRDEGLVRIERKSFPGVLPNTEVPALAAMLA